MLAQLQVGLARTLARLENSLYRLRRALLPAPLVVFEDVSAHWLASLVSAAAASGLDRAVGEDSSSLAELESRLGIPAPQLKRMVRTLAPYGYFRLEGEQVSHTRLSRSLARQGNDFARLQGADWYRASFLRPEQAMAASVSGFELNQGMPFFDYLEQTPEACEIFAGAMTCVSAYTADAVARAFPFQNYESVLDVGGGKGILTRELGKRFPGLRAAVMDRAEVVADLEHLEGDFFESVPSGYELLILKNILHDWEDGPCISILENCRRTGSELLVVELLLPPDSSPSPAWLVDFNIWMTLGGRERTLVEYERLFAKAGYGLEAEYPTYTPFSVLHAVPV